MNRALPIVLGLALLVSVAFSLSLRLDAQPPATMQRVPVFSPASLGVSASGGVRCPGADAVGPNSQALTRVPLEQLLDTLTRSGGAQQSPEVQAALAAVAQHHRGLLDLRNQRHAWNVESMQRVTALVDVLGPAQLEWVLSNRDRVSKETMDQGTWRRLGIEP